MNYTVHRDKKAMWPRHLSQYLKIPLLLSLVVVFNKIMLCLVLFPQGFPWQKHKLLSLCWCYLELGPREVTRVRETRARALWQWLYDRKNGLSRSVSLTTDVCCYIKTECNHHQMRSFNLGLPCLQTCSKFFSLEIAQSVFCCSNRNWTETQSWVALFNFT